MIHRALLGFIILAGVGAGGEALRSGPQPGSLLPGSFAPFNVNGEFKGRPHCLVNGFGFRPVVLVFASEPAEEHKAALTSILEKTQGLVDKYSKEDLKAFVVFLSLDAKNALFDPKNADAFKLTGDLAREAEARAALLKRLEDWAGKTKDLVVTMVPPPEPKAYNLNDKAAVTVLLYHRYKVLDNFAFSEKDLTPEALGPMFEKLESSMAEVKKSLAKKKK